MNHDTSTCVAGKCRKDNSLLFRLVDQCSDKQNNSEYRAGPEIKRNMFLFFAGQHLFRGSLLSMLNALPYSHTVKHCRQNSAIQSCLQQ